MINLRMWEKLANGEHPYDGGPLSADHIKVFRDDARDVLGALGMTYRDVPDEAARWIAEALADPDAPNGTITFRSARAVFDLVRRFDATGESGWK